MTDDQAAMRRLAPNKMRAILIDPTAKTVSEVECDGSLQDIYRLCECQMIEAVHLPGNHHIYVDEEGLMKAEPGPFFMYAGYGQPLAGRGLILSQGEDGEEMPCSLDLVLVRASVSFPAVQHTGMSTSHEDDVEMPWGGKGFRINIVPHFEDAPSPGRFEFPDTGTAYDACQVNEQIKSGDMLIINAGAGPAVIGLAGAYPVAVTSDHGNLHAMREGAVADAEMLARFNWTEAQVRAAVAEAVMLGLPLAPGFEAYR